MHIITVFNTDLVLSFVRAWEVSVCSWLTELHSTILAICFNYQRGMIATCR